jgi:hypothetical protein
MMTRVRSVASSLGVQEGALLSFLRDACPERAHPAAFISDGLIESFLRSVGVATVRAPAQAEDDVSPTSQERAAARMTAALRAKDIRRVLVVGGAPSTREHLLRLTAGAVEVRCVDGEARPQARVAAAQKRWADLVVIWSSTILAHRVSNHYQAEPGVQQVIVVRRGVGSLCNALAERYEV